MAILKNLEVHWVKLHPDYPAAAFGDSGPKWEMKIRTKSKEQKAEWEALNIKPKLKEDASGTYYEATLRKPTHKKPKKGQEEGEPNLPVKVVGGSLSAIDPRSIGNGSIVNARVYQYPYDMKDPKTGKVLKTGISTMLMDVQVTKLKKYEPREGESFEMEDMEVIEPSDEQQNETMDDPGDDF